MSGPILITPVPNVADQLNDTGYIIDGKPYTRVVLQKHLEELETIMRGEGYTGGKLNCLGAPNDSVFVAYDTDVFDYDEAKRLVARVRQEHGY